MLGKDRIDILVNQKGVCHHIWNYFNADNFKK